MDAQDVVKEIPVVVRGRHLDLGEFWVQHVKEKMAPLARFNNDLRSFDVEVFHENNPRQASQAWRVEVSAIGKAAPFRATGTGAEAEIAFERARETLEHTLRRAHKKSRWSRHGSGSTTKLGRLLGR